MKRILLASGSPGIAALPSLVDGKTRGLRLLFVPTAAGPDGEEKDWVQRDRRQLEILGCEVAMLDLATVGSTDVDQALRDVDGVFLTGGSAYLLHWHVRRSGFAKLVSPLVEAGSLLYAGTSAGALLAGPGLIPAAEEERQAAVPGLESSEALGFVDFTILPHDQDPERAAHHEALVAAHPEREFVRLTDEQAVVVRGDEREIVASPPAAQAPQRG